MSLILKNPHSILAALNTRPGDVKQLCLPTSNETGPWQEVEKKAKKAGISIRPGIAQASVEERNPLTADELWGPKEIDPNAPALWLALDCIQDPHNVGAIFRSAAFFGIRGVLLTQERSAPLTSTAYDVASGGMEYVPFAIQINLQRALESAKKKGIWILGSSEHAKDPIQKIPRDRPWLLVLGNEEKGLRRLTEENCDMMCTIPCAGQTRSLNVSVAAGILISTLTSN